MRAILGFLILESLIVQYFLTTGSGVELDQLLSIQTSVCNYVPLCNVSATDTSKPTDIAHPLGFCCRGCSCKDECRLLGNCCPDKTFTQEQLNSSTASARHFECIFADLKRNKRSELSGREFFMIANCPSAFKDFDLKNRCTNRNNLMIEEITPVYSLQTDTVYVNRFCAECHNESAHDILPWTATLKCKSADFLNDEKTFNTSTTVVGNYDQQVRIQRILTSILSDVMQVCNVVFEPPSQMNIYDHECVSETIDNCNENGLSVDYDDWLIEGCKAYRLPYGIPVYAGPVYKNIFCYYCNTRPDLNIQSEFCSLNNNQNFFGMPLTAILSIYEDVEQEETPNRCEELYPYDPVTGQCFTPLCPIFAGPPYCLPWLTDVSAVPVAINLRLEPFMNYSLSDLSEDIFKEIIERISSWISSRLGSLPFNQICMDGVWAKLIPTAVEEDSHIEYIMIPLQVILKRLFRPRDIYSELQTIQTQMRQVQVNDVSFSVSIDNRPYDKVRRFSNIVSVRYKTNTLRCLFRFGNFIPDACKNPIELSKFKVCPQIQIGSDRYSEDRNQILLKGAAFKPLEKHDVLTIGDAEGQIRICIDDYLGSLIVSSASRTIFECSYTCFTWAILIGFLSRFAYT